MDGEFVRELQDTGWGKGKWWKSQGDQVDLLVKAVRATSTSGDPDKAQKKVQEDVRKLLERKSVDLKHRGSLAVKLGEEAEQCRKRAREVSERKKEVSPIPDVGGRPRLEEPQ